MASTFQRATGICIALSLLGGCTIIRIPEHRRKASLWATASGEYAAVALQTYNAARKELDGALADPSWTACMEQRVGFEALPPAVIVDLDETVLDNRPFQLQMIRENRDFDAVLWRQWVEDQAAEAIPGAVEFLQAVDEREIEIFYITNREHVVEAATRKTLISLGLPVNPDRDTVLTKHERPGWLGDKVGRREFVVATHRVVMIIGDHLRDFASVEGFSHAQRRSMVFENSAMWGRKWFMLPNPIYGRWAAEEEAKSSE